jgi:hypothetical protein
MIFSPLIRLSGDSRSQETKNQNARKLRWAYRFLHRATSTNEIVNSSSKVL